MSLAFHRSKMLLAESRRYLASGVSSTLRLAVGPTPLFIERGAGAELIDVDGNRLIDYVLGYGPLILGHAHPTVVRAVSEAIAQGSTFGAQHEREIHLSRRICELVPNVELVCFSGSGTEAVMVALRLARAFTGRQKVIRFVGHYHGWSDAIFTSSSLHGPTNLWASDPAVPGQTASALTDVLLLPWNDPEALSTVFATLGDELAAVICEPVLCNAGCLLPAPGYLEQIRSLTAAHRTVLIFDEVITGFRIALGGAQERFGIASDLAVFGKALSGGYPLSAVAGRSEIMNLISEGTVSHLGTLNGNPVSTSAAIATLAELSKDNGAVYGHMEARAAQLVQGIHEHAEQAGIPVTIRRVGSVFHLSFTDADSEVGGSVLAHESPERAATFAEALLREGVFVRPDGLWYLSACHTTDHIEFTARAVGRALQALDSTTRTSPGGWTRQPPGQATLTFVGEPSVPPGR